MKGEVVDAETDGEKEESRYDGFPVHLEFSGSVIFQIHFRFPGCFRGSNSDDGGGERQLLAPERPANVL